MTQEELNARFGYLLAAHIHRFWLHWSPLGRSCPEGACPYE